MNSKQMTTLSGLIFGRIINTRKLGRLLIEKKISISACESCTGGLFAASLVSVPGISEVFDRGIVTYSDKSKIEELGVSAESIEKFTAESPEVAREMAKGLFEKTDSRICIASTGVAGPDDMDDIPAGTMWIGISVDGDIFVKELRTEKRNREWNRFFCARIMVHEVRKICQALD